MIQKTNGINSPNDLEPSIDGYRGGKMFYMEHNLLKNDDIKNITKHWNHETTKRWNIHTDKQHFFTVHKWLDKHMQEYYEEAINSEPVLQNTTPPPDKKGSQTKPT